MMSFTIPVEITLSGKWATISRSKCAYNQHNFLLCLESYPAKAVHKDNLDKKDVVGGRSRLARMLLRCPTTCAWCGRSHRIITL